MVFMFFLNWINVYFSSQNPIKMSLDLNTERLKASSVAKRMSENFDGISDLKDLIYQLNVVKIQRQEISNQTSIKETSQ